jgi:HSP20 family protein
LEISVENNTLTIRGEISKEVERDDERWHIRERRYGVFQRSITLPNNVDPDQVGAVYEDGVLTLTLPKVEEAKPRRISVQGGARRNGHKTIEGQAQQQNGQQMEGEGQQRSGQRRQTKQREGQQAAEAEAQQRS